MITETTYATCESCNRYFEIDSRDGSRQTKCPRCRIPHAYMISMTEALYEISLAEETTK